MNLKHETLEELQIMLWKMEAEKEAVDARIPSEIQEVGIRGIEFEKAKDNLDYASDQLIMSKGRSEQLVGIIDALKKEIATK